jgi:hypothetical protein
MLGMNVERNGRVQEGRGRRGRKEGRINRGTTRDGSRPGHNTIPIPLSVILCLAMPG